MSKIAKGFWYDYQLSYPKDCSYFSTMSEFQKIIAYCHKVLSYTKYMYSFKCSTRIWVHCIGNKRDSGEYMAINRKYEGSVCIYSFIFYILRCFSSQIFKCNMNLRCLGDFAIMQILNHLVWIRAGDILFQQALRRLHLTNQDQYVLIPAIQ